MKKRKVIEKAKKILPFVLCVFLFASSLKYKNSQYFSEACIWGILGIHSARLDRLEKK